MELRLIRKWSALVKTKSDFFDVMLFKAKGSKTRPAKPKLSSGAGFYVMLISRNRSTTQGKPCTS